MAQTWYERIFDALPGTLVRSRQMIQEFTAIQTGLDKLESVLKIKYTRGAGEQTLDLSTSQRANKLISFDASGNVTVTTGAFSWEGDWVTATDYTTNDIVRDPNSPYSLYVATTAHTSGTLATDIADGKMDLVLDMSTVITMVTNSTNVTSTTSNSLGTGTKTWTTTSPTGRPIVVGMTYKMARTSDPAKWVAGTVLSYNSTTGELSIDVDHVNPPGSTAGPYTDWTGSLSAALTETFPWSMVSSTPTTRAGYGITDAAANGAVTGSGLTMTTARLLGRTTASTGAIEELTVSGMLTLTGGVLGKASTDPVVQTYPGSPAASWTRAATQASTYSRTGTTVTVTKVAHGFATGDRMWFDFTSGTATDQWGTITVTGADTYTFTHGTSGSTSGNVTVYPPIVISLASHGLSNGNTPVMDYTATLTDTENSATGTVYQTATNTFQIAPSTDSNTTNNTAGANSSGTVYIRSLNRSYTWTKPAGLAGVEVYMTSGGTQGTGISSGSAAGQVGIGGVAGAYLWKRWIAAASLGSTETVTVGRGGYTTTGSGAGETGGTSSFGSHLTCTGTVPTGGDMNKEGRYGTSASALGSAYGGDSNWGIGAAVPGSNGMNGVAATVTNYGAGGSGARADNVSDFRGGYGAPGVVIVIEHYQN